MPVSTKQSSRGREMENVGPHIVIHERLVIGGQPIRQAAFAKPVLDGFYLRR